MRRVASVIPVSLVVVVGLVGCRAESGRQQGNHPGGPSGGGGGDDGGGPGNPMPACDPGADPASDQDGDGYTIAQGDCDDCNPTINPGAIQIAGDMTDYACNGMPGVVPLCDSQRAGKRDAASLASAFEQCDKRFFLGAQLVGPSDLRARKVVSRFGVIKTRAGESMALLSNGIAADKSDPDFDKFNEENPGTDLGEGNTHPNPLPNLPGVPGCSQSQPGTVNDYTELVVKLKAPTNAKSFAFDFQFFSAEYPVYVCTEFNDEFLVLQESNGEFGMPTNIAFDMAKNPVTVNNGFFTVCENDQTKPETQHCKHPVSQISGTGFEDLPGAGVFGGILGGGSIPGGSTGWLTTTSPVTPGEEVTLHFILFDEGDHVLDSAVLIDHFRWQAMGVPSPSTSTIQ